MPTLRELGLQRAEAIAWYGVAAPAGLPAPIQTRLTSALEAGLVLASLPAVIALAAWAAFGERLALRGILGVTLAVAAIATLNAARGPAGAAPVGSLAGNALVFGCVLAETGQLELAAAAFEGALRYHEDYPDAHYHLARTLDELGQYEAAGEHWRSFLALVPTGPWAEEARRRLGWGAVDS